MSEENKLVEETKDKEPSFGDDGGRSKCREEPFPPKMKWWEWILWFIAWAFLLGGLAVAANQLCFRIGPECVCCTYIAFGFVIVGLIIYRWVRHRFIVHESRLEDRSEVDSLLAEARTVVEPKSMKSGREDENERRKEQLKKEMDRLEQLGEKGWTEYQVLQFNQMLVDFLPEAELVGRAQLTLEELKEYAQDSAYRYEWEQFCFWQDKIEEAIDKIENIEGAGDDEDKRKTDVAALRARLKTLIEYVTDYYAYWAEGSAIVRGIRMCGVFGLFPLLAMGLLPIVHPGGDKVLGVFNWGLLGMSGSITAVLLSLRKSDFVEVGGTEGKKELWRAVLGAALGFIAGILVYSMIAGGVLSGALFPTIIFFEEQESKELALSIFWAITAGYSFEWVFDHLRSATGRTSYEK